MARVPITRDSKHSKEPDSAPTRSIFRNKGTGKFWFFLDEVVPYVESELNLFDGKNQPSWWILIVEKYFDYGLLISSSRCEQKGHWLTVQFSSVTQSCPTLCNPMNRSTPGLPVHHQLPSSTQTHVHRVSDAIQPSHPLSSPSPPAPNPSQHQGLFQWVNSSHEVAKVLEFQL